MSITYTLPALKKPKEEKTIDMPMEVFPGEYDRKVHIPLSKEQVKALQIGANEIVILKGEVVELESSERKKGRDRNMVTISITSVEVEAKNDIEKLLDDDE